MKNTGRAAGFLLAVLMIFGFLPFEAAAAENESHIIPEALFEIPEGEADAAPFAESFTEPEKVTAEQASARLSEFIEKFEGKFFTVNGSWCTSSGIHATTSCSNCKMSNVIASEWVEELVGMGKLSASLCPTQYNYNGSQWSSDGWQCFGFSNFAHWYIFAGKNTDKIRSTLEFTGPMTRETLIKALPGDVLRSNYYGGHSMVFISCDEEGFTVLDSNYVSNSTGNYSCQVKIHKVKYNPKYTVAVTGTENYDRESATEYFIVKYDPNGGKNAPENQIKTEDITLILSGDIPVFEGRTFLGWSASSEAETPEFLPGAEFSGNADITLYAVWSECGHSYASEIKAPTCTEGGYTLHTCIYCGENFTDSHTEAAGHTEVTDEAKEPTCTEEGLSEGSHCSVCGEVFSPQEVLPAKGHVFDGDTDGICNICGFERPVDICGDANGDGKISAKDATRIMQYLTALPGGEEIDLEKADFNRDGRVSSRDATAILRYIIGL